ncbi:putative major facilitator superfamily transporter [Cladophialophora carrionii]|uniref:Putative major facilitator superfamily transporter n=1 Tax=Cladophialophora carrionii TaxID=86049 RepID=A0A1C1CH81_9EURO|nr:putative major facilitator superfamily transporter [Cladophialophora carrionii]
MSVLPPENTDRLEHERQHDAELLHDKEMTEHREHVHHDEKSQVKEELTTASPSEPSSDTPEYQTKTVWTLKTFVATVALSGLYVGSQIPLYFVGGSLTFIAADIGGSEASAWLSVSYALALSAVAPFCGYLQDLVGRRNITLGGGVALMMGCIVLATARSFGAGVVGMSFAGAGAAIGELTALAGTSELVPVNKRGIYLALVTLFVLPFAPYLLYAQLLSTYHTWRWGIWICLIWNGLWWVIIFIVYFPESQIRAKGQAAKAILKRIDYIGGALSIMGLTLILVALQAGGYSHPWSSGYVIAQLIVGVFLLAAFVVWEWKYCKDPMVPHEMFTGQRIVAMAYGIAFIAGMNFYAMLNFFPLAFSSIFDPDPVKVGLRGLAAGLSTTFGAVIANAALSWFKGHNRELLLAGCIIMTAFGGSFATVNPDREGLAIGLGTMTGFGVGAVLVPAATVAVTVTPDTSIATCVALSLTIRAVGGSIGYAIYYNVFINKLTPKLPAYIGEYAVAAGLPLSSAEQFVATYLGAPANLTAVPGVNAQIIDAAAIGSRWAYADSLKYVWLTSISFGACAIIACLFIGNISKYMTNRVAARIRE